MQVDPHGELAALCLGASSGLDEQTVAKPARKHPNRVAVGSGISHAKECSSILSLVTAEANPSGHEFHGYSDNEQKLRECSKGTGHVYGRKWLSLA